MSGNTEKLHSYCVLCLPGYLSQLYFVVVANCLPVTGCSCDLLLVTPHGIRTSVSTSVSRIATCLHRIKANGRFYFSIFASMLFNCRVHDSKWIFMFGMNALWGPGIEQVRQEREQHQRRVVVVLCCGFHNITIERALII